MGQHQSKEELLYEQAKCGNVVGIQALRRQGAGLEWVDREGKTPLIVACMKPELYSVAKALIELGARMNAYRPGCQAGTPLHHAAKLGLENTVKLLLSCGANALVMNDDGQTALDVARINRHSNVVRVIESHLCLFSGWLRELYGPSFLEVLVPKLLSRKVWVVVVPCGSRTLTKPFKLELAIYTGLQDAQPRTHIALWKVNMQEPKFNQPDPSVIIYDNSTKTHIRLAPANERDGQQLPQFCNACKGIPQVMHTSFPFNFGEHIVPTTTLTSAEDVESARETISATQSAVEASPPHIDANLSSGANLYSSSHGTSAAPALLKESVSGCEILEVGPSGILTQNIQNQSDISAVVQSTPGIPVSSSLPSAPMVDNVVADDGPVNYPSVDAGPIDLSPPVEEKLPDRVDDKNEDAGASSSCVICLDAPVEGACIPCGHMAGCMSCLNEIKAKKWGCPVCRAKIEQVMRIYAV